eukprot:CAMPEP_0202964806 /NCGR_PEP_ID=MMETSP1396-20130829/8902_1 /ASSEMBLY_ACC=CAM_ASM_000872 /TAXON_ID= /ORGANISM="Pseudokeronopsis sp., Strain Brazil" /LENGTH=131 /DNA_ID=CAMNT_0049687189 /DNA_START=1449 /DNA_END=1844 /DNA_ORIENTATION=+
MTTCNFLQWTRKFDKEINFVVLVELFDVANVAFLSQLFKEVLVLTHPFLYWQLSDADLVFRDALEPAFHNVPFTAILTLYCPCVALVPGVHFVESICLSFEPPFEIVDNVKWGEAGDAGSPASANTFCSVH